MPGQANHEADRQAPVQDSLVGHRPPHLGQVLADPGQDCPAHPEAGGTLGSETGPLSLCGQVGAYLWLWWFACCDDLDVRQSRK